MKRKPLGPVVKEAAIARLNEVMRKFCEDVEQRKEEEGRLAADKPEANI